MTRHASHTALVTGATSGLGLATARKLALDGWKTVIVTGRTEQRARDAVATLEQQTGTQVFVPLALDLSDFDSISEAADALAKRNQPLDLVLLNAGLVGWTEPVRGAHGIERTFQSSTVGHHALTVRLLNEGVIASTGRIVISGSEAARGDVPMMFVEDVAAFSAAHTDGDRAAAIQIIVRAEAPWVYDPNNAYATTKALSAWWAAALSRRLPAGITVNAVSPGSRPQTNAARNMPRLVGWAMTTMMRWVGPWMGMAGPLEDGVQRYVDAADYGDEVTGQFLASPAGKLVGPLEVQAQPHILDQQTQEASFRALVALSGAELTTPIRATA